MTFPRAEVQKGIQWTGPALKLISPIPPILYIQPHIPTLNKNILKWCSTEYQTIYIKKKSIVGTFADIPNNPYSVTKDL